MSKRIAMLAGALMAAGLGTEILPRRESFFPRPVWHEEPDEQAQTKIAKAEEKRQRKAAKRSKESI